MSQGQQNYMKNDIMNMNWANIQSEYNFTYKETDTNKRFLLWGALMHIGHGQKIVQEIGYILEAQIQMIQEKFH